jgi:hypothetical protein
MKKKPSVRFPNPKTVAQPDERHWHNGGDIEIMMYARSLHRTAMKLASSLDLRPNPNSAWDACPVILLYRQAVELHLKMLVGEGSTFLPSPTDPITLYKTHSLRWLAQIVCQIIKTVGWEKEFKCEGVASLAEFSALVNELEALDPVSCAVQSSKGARAGSVPPQLQPPNVVRLAGKLDGLLSLLDAATDALTATWEKMSGEETFQAGDDFKPTIQ